MDLTIYCREMWHLALQGETQGIWFWAAIYALAMCVYSSIYQVRTRYWPFVHGDLKEFEAEKFVSTDWDKSDQEYISKALYKYKVSGADFYGTRISPWLFVASHNARIVLEKQMSFIQRFPDGKVKVFYNPDNPKKSFLIIAGKLGSFITLSISVLPLIGFYYKYHV